MGDTEGREDDGGGDDDDENSVATINEEESGTSSAKGGSRKKRRKEFLNLNATFMAGVPGVTLVTDQVDCTVIKKILN